MEPSIEIKENIILGSIIYQLSQKFGNNYKYYDEPIDQGFDKPSFHVTRIDGTNRKGYTSESYKMENNSYRYEIKYFPQDSNQLIKDINDKIDDLKKLFRYLNIVNIKTVEGVKVINTKPNRVNQIEYNVSDGVLLFDIIFDLRTVEYTDIDKVLENILTEEIK